MKTIKKIFDFFINIPTVIKIIIHLVRQEGKEIKTLEFDNHQEISSKKYDFDEFYIENMIYPENNTKNRFYEIDIMFIINKNNEVDNIKFSDEKIYNFRNTFKEVNFKKTKKDLFFCEAKKIIYDYKDWIPYRNKGLFVEGWVYKSIQFSYHKEYFRNKLGFCLNPDSRPFYINKNNDLYQQIIKCKYGCDGEMNILCIVEKDGELSNIEIIDCAGKISYDSVFKSLYLLGKWKPGIKNGEPVRTQLDLKVYI